MTLLCITNQMPEFRSCTIRGQHTVRCDSFEYRWVEKRHREEATGRLCTGCLPRLAQKGLLCWGCWERVEAALIEWTPLRAATMAHLERAVQRDTGGRTSGPEGYVPIPGTVLAVEEIWSYRRGAPEDPALWVSSEVGAKNAVRFARAVPAALRTHELEEKAHKIRRTRCTECKQLTLVWKPPARDGGHVAVVCTNPECGAHLPQESFEKVAAIEKPDQAAAAAVLIDGGQALNRSGFFAEDYDPTKPEHEELDPLTALTIADLLDLAKGKGFDDDALERMRRLRKNELIDAIRAAETDNTRRATA